MIVIGLTGTIASGKTTTAAMLAEAGIPVFNADEAVHRLYAGPAAARVEAAFPGVVEGGVVDRKRLGAMLELEPYRLADLEAIVHPLVRAAEAAFVAEANAARQPMVVLEIPLLFETGAEERMDVVITTTAPEPLRRSRAMERLGMTPARYQLLSARQHTDAEKRAGAHYVVDTSRGMDAAERDVRAILAKIAESRR